MKDTSSLLVFSGRTTGPSHIARGAPCEDFVTTKWSEDRNWLCAVVCDGCGSVARAEQGAEFIANFIAEGLLELVYELDSHGPGDWIVDELVVLVAKLRKAMRRDLEPPINQYAATIVSALVSNKGGFIFHIGDGIASAFDGDRTAGRLNLRLIGQSSPANGEFVNQTYYPTDKDWIRSVRITPLPPFSSMIITTDGGQDLFYEGSLPYGPAIISTLKMLPQSDDPSGFSIDDVLGSDGASDRSSDDKSMVIIIKEDFLKCIKDYSVDDIVLDNSLLLNTKAPQESEHNIYAKEDKVGDTEIIHNSVFTPIVFLKSKAPTYFLNISKVSWYIISGLVAIIFFGLLIWYISRYQNGDSQVDPASLEPPGEAGGQTGPPPRKALDAGKVPWLGTGL